MKLFFATHNLDKKREIEYIFRGKFKVLYINDYRNYPEVEETGITLAENSLIKASAGYKFTGIASFGDDTGLEVNCLNGKPGIYAARYAGENATYKDNYLKLLDKMKGANCKNRAARFRTVITICLSENKFESFEGICDGHIVKNPSGEIGFGYDPVFIPNGYNKTFAKMESDVKNTISHRAIALKKFIDFLKNKYGA